jgi:class 3 adenylate cyclase
VYTNGVEDTVKEAIAKYIRKQLRAVTPPGYECQEDNGCWMLAFDRMANAVFFGLQLVRSVDEKLYRDDIFKIGIVTGPFTSMGPHKTTGMADYFGPIVNRAARVASNCKLGEVCVGIPLENGATADPPDFGDTVTVRLDGLKKLKGISVDTAIFSCQLARTGYAF